MDFKADDDTENNDNAKETATVPTTRCAGYSWWTDAIVGVVDVDSAEHMRTTLAGMTLSYASDCTGSNGAIFALHGLAEAFAENFGVNFSIDHAFASEIDASEGDSARAFIQANHPPRIMFRDMVKRGAKGHCDYAGQQVETPGCDIYFAGTECKDVASSNRYPKKLDLEHGEGRSSTTLRASLQYIARFQPAVVLLEDSYKKEVIEVMQREMRKMNVYDFVVFRMDPASFKLKQTRRRAIACGVNLKNMVHRPHRFV